MDKTIWVVVVHREGESSVAYSYTNKEEAEGRAADSINDGHTAHMFQPQIKNVTDPDEVVVDLSEEK